MQTVRNTDFLLENDDFHLQLFLAISWIFRLKLEDNDYVQELSRECCSEIQERVGFQEHALF